MTWPLSPWYPATTKPVRPGVYLCTRPSWVAIHMLRWDGRMWRYQDGVAALSDWHWRGLAFDPASATEVTTAIRGWWVPKP